MAKDYAKTTFKSARASGRRRSERGPFFFILILASLLLAVLLGWYFYQHKAAVFNKEKAVTFVDKMKAFLHPHTLQTTVRETPKPEPITTAAEEPDIRFDFYTELPSMQITMPVTQDAANQGTSPVSRVSNPLKSSKTSSSAVVHAESPEAAYSPSTASRSDDIAAARASSTLHSEGSTATHASSTASHANNATAGRTSSMLRAEGSTAAQASSIRAEEGAAEQASSSFRAEGSTVHSSATPGDAGTIATTHSTAFDTDDSSATSFFPTKSTGATGALGSSSASRSKPINSPSPGPRYVVQVGAYKNSSTASEMRVSILLAGFDAKVVKTSVGGQTIYRIQQGPYSSLARAKMIQQNLQAKGFDGVIQRLN